MEFQTILSTFLGNPQVTTMEVTFCDMINGLECT